MTTNGKTEARRFEPVRTPPHFTVNCYVCGKSVNTAHEVLWADLNGEPFRAYYCRGCKVKGKA